ncbi:hypothetical protein [Streptomyces exfoliatus]|uniref:hypothetical protein n=1 Tax=Streptomyces exfoliatus TaxID=1905 RepID=UPI0032434F29
MLGLGGGGDHSVHRTGAGLVEQRDQGPKRVNRLRRDEFEARFPGLLDLLLRADDTGSADSGVSAG